MFFSNDLFPFTAMLEQHWQVIRDEVVRLQDGAFLDWPEKHLYEKGWSVFGLYGWGLKLDKNCALCPETTRLVEQIPDLVTASFSQMKPNTHLVPHNGYPEGVLRCHLGLIVPPHCGIRVGDETRTWNEGKCMVFDDTTEHEAWNKSDRERIVLIMDFKSDLAATHATLGPPPPRQIREWTKFVFANLARVQGFVPKVKALGYFVSRANKR
jgi:ornithine lipid ester-linked acyl 2-hydroxylase